MEHRKRLVAVDWSLGVLSLLSHRRNNNHAIRNISNNGEGYAPSGTESGVTRCLFGREII